MNRYLIIILLLLLSIHRTFAVENIPVSTFKFQAKSNNDLFLGTEQVLREINDPTIFTPSTCSPYISALTSYLYNVKSDYFIPKNSDEIERLRIEGVSLLNSLFKIRTNLRERMQEFYQDQNLSLECSKKIREGLQYSRIIEEYLLEWLVHNNVIPASTPNILDPDPHFTMVNSRYENSEIKSGDILLVRGSSFISAMIARIGDEESHFSHLAMVGESPEGQLFVIEALIQYGIVITPLEEWKKSKEARVALFRYPDIATSIKAGRFIYDFSKQKIADNGEVKYDFAMNDSDHERLFCAEVAKLAYKQATDGNVVLPAFKSSLSKFTDTTYPNSLGVYVKTLFAPFDIEVEPRFDLVAEYRFYPILRQVRMQDAVLQSIYSWMGSKKYKFNFSLSTSMKSLLGKILRRTGYMKEAMPKYMPLKTINTVAQFQIVSSILENNLYQQENDFYLKNGHLPTFKDFMEINEIMRKSDCKKHRAETSKLPIAKLYQIWDRWTHGSQFHWIFSNQTNNTCE